MIELFLDSGAYSAWTKKESINLQDYIDFIHKNKHLISVYCNLDDIESPKKTWENQVEMEKQGLAPLPVYHVDEPIEYLFTAMKYDFFGVGGMALASATGRENAFNRIFKALCVKENDYKPVHKIHGLGMTSSTLLWRFPWYSTDSGSWMQYSKYGAILYPSTLKGKLDYRKPPKVIFVSERSPSQHIESGPHYNQLSKNQQNKIIAYLGKKDFILGESEMIEENEKRVENVIEKGLRNDHKLRDQLNLMHFIESEHYTKDWPWEFVRQDLWDEEEEDFISPHKKVHDTSQPTSKVQIYFAGNFPLMKDIEAERANRNKVCMYYKSYRRLISYYYKDDIQNLLDLKQEELDES